MILGAPTDEVLDQGGDPALIPGLNLHLANDLKVIGQQVLQQPQGPLVDGREGRSRTSAIPADHPALGQAETGQAILNGTSAAMTAE